jgi:hypothetical protein
MCSQKYAKLEYAIMIKYAEHAKYVILKKICRICTPHFADEASSDSVRVPRVDSVSAEPGSVGRDSRGPPAGPASEGHRDRRFREAPGPSVTITPARAASHGRGPPAQVEQTRKPVTVASDSEASSSLTESGWPRLSSLSEPASGIRQA